MSFQNTNFQYNRAIYNAVTGLNVIAPHTYETVDDTRAEVGANDYFLEADLPKLKVGDFLFIRSSDEPDIRVIIVLTDTSIETVSVLGVLPPGSVDTNDLADLAVTTPKIADLAVTTLKIDPLAVTDAKIADVNGSKIVNSSIPVGKYGLASILDADISTLSGAKLISSTVPEAALDAGLTTKVNRVKASGIFTLTNVAVNNETVSVPGLGVVATDIILIIMRAPGATPLTVVSAVTGTNDFNVALSGNIVGDEIIQYMILSPLS